MGRRLPALVLVGLGFSLGGCSANTSGIPCKTSDQCPVGYLCDPIVGQCYVAPGREAASRDGSSVDQARPDSAPRIDSTPDEKRPDVLRPPDTLGLDACVTKCGSSTCPAGVSCFTGDCSCGVYTVLCYQCGSCPLGASGCSANTSCP